jgi:hypothetical protein
MLDFLVAPPRSFEEAKNTSSQQKLKNHHTICLQVALQAWWHSRRWPLVMAWPIWLADGGVNLIHGDLGIPNPLQEAWRFVELLGEHRLELWRGCNTGTVCQPLTWTMLVCAWLLLLVAAIMELIPVADDNYTVPISAGIGAFLLLPVVSS